MNKMAMCTILLLAVFGCAVEPEPEPSDMRERASTIHGGWATNSGEFPQVVYVSTGGFMCTGTLITPTTVLTAAHCLDHWPSVSDVWVGFGESSSSLDVFAASSYQLHPDFDMDYLFGAVISSHHDTALIHLSTPAPYPLSRLVSPAEESAYVTEGSTAWIAGFGENDLSGLPSSGIKVWGLGYASNVKDWVIRLDDFPSSACSGDSGGPFYSQVPGVGLKQAGVLSFGAPSCESWNKYARITLDLWWIHTNATLPCDSGLPCTQRCGNYTCELPDENMYTCPQDCAYTACGNGSCDPYPWGEHSGNCATDCYCGDGICEWEEKELGTCLGDCTPRDCDHAQCFNGVCDQCEDRYVCPEDCH
jgi:hypothetical protein